MSIGNLKDTGNQGNNLPFQWKVLQGLQSIISSTFNVKIKDPLGQQGNDTSVSVTLSSDQANGIVQAGFRRFANSDSDLTGFPIIFSVSFASVGTADARISFDGGTVFERLKPGETLNLDAGAVMNYYDGGLIFWDTTTNVGSELIVAYNYI